GRDDNGGAKHSAAALPPIPKPAPKAAPPSGKHDFPVAGEALDGAYRIDVNREQQSYNGSPDPQPPNVITWWAFRTACTPASCVATGAMLDETGHLQLSAAGGSKAVVLDFRNGGWQSRPDTMLFACVGPDNAPAEQTTTQTLSLQKDHAAFHGTMTVTVETNECGQQGATIEIPSVATRVAEVPPGVEVPTPPSSTPPASAKPPR
ncbi:MAG: serine/threonine protein kinase, bacterial, partial [Mycobacterium sp.]|nr:serine/threonine protein kinase, bacterial [Mycobacterium sp.]